MSKVLTLAKVLAFCLIVNNTYGESLYLQDMETNRGLVEVGVNSASEVLEIKVNGSVIFRNDSYDDVYIMAAHAIGDKPELLLLNFFGGNACAGFFRVADLRGTGPVRVSEEFGNCNELIQPEEWSQGNLRENPCYCDGEWRIALPSRDEPSKKLTWYVYKEGVVTEEGQGNVEHNDDDWRYEEKLAKEIPDAAERKKLIEKHGSAAAAFSFILMKKAEEKISQ